MKNTIFKTVAALLFLALSTTFAAAQAPSNVAASIENPGPEGVPPETGTSLTMQLMSGNGLQSYIYGLRWYSGHHLFQFQFKSRSDRPREAYQRSLKNERWVEVALLYGYRHGNGSFRMHAAAGPGYISSKELGDFISSVEFDTRKLWENKIGRDFYYLEHTRNDTYEVLIHNSVGLVFDAGVGMQIWKHVYAGVGAHGGFTARTSEIGITFSFGYGAF